MSKPPGSRVRSLHILCTACRVPRYERVEDARVYSVVAPEYLVSGGDGYTVIGEEMITHKSGETLGSGGRFWFRRVLTFFSVGRRSGRFRGDRLHQPTPAGVSSRRRSHQLLQRRGRAGPERRAGYAGPAGAALDRLSWRRRDRPSCAV